MRWVRDVQPVSCCTAHHVCPQPCNSRKWQWNAAQRIQMAKQRVCHLAIFCADL